MSNLNKKQLSLLTAIHAETTTGPGFKYYDPDSKELKKLAEFGYVELNAKMHDDAGNIAARSTDAGANLINNEGKQNMSTAQSAATATKSAAASKFAIVSVALPTAKRGGGRTGSTYPFDALEVGQSFFVAATEDRPDPAKSLASTVTSANERFSEVIPGEFRTNRKGNTVPKTKQIRQFAIRSIEDGAAWGHPGVKGAAVGRVELSEVEDSDE